jgi:hypothetical protein
MTPLGTDGLAVRAEYATKRYPRIILETAWLAYMLFTLLGYDACGISIMLYSILLCGLATWLYNYKIGIITSFLSLLYNIIIMTYHTTPTEGWEMAAEPGGVLAQLFSVLVIAIEQRNRNRAIQLTELYDHSEKLINVLSHSNAPQIPDAIKLRSIAETSIEQVNNLTETLSSKTIIAHGIKHVLINTCAYLTETTGTSISINISERYRDLPNHIALHIHRIAHEALTNALRHGKATQIELSLEFNESHCLLSVINNGNPLSKYHGEGIGMKLIQQRAVAIHATTKLSTTPSGKTQFECITPLCP